MNNKKTYIAPTMDIVRIAPASVIATSVQVYDSSDTSSSSATVITGDNKSEFEFNSNAFQGGLLDEE